MIAWTFLALALLCFGASGIVVVCYAWTCRTDAKYPPIVTVLAVLLFPLTFVVLLFAALRGRLAR